MMALLTVDHAGCGGDDVVGGGVVVVVVVASGAARLSRSLDFYSTVLNDTCDLVSLKLSGFAHAPMFAWAFGLPMEDLLLASLSENLPS